jgi:phage-related minor tail protein
MAKSVLDIVIRTIKEGGGDKETVKGMVAVKDTFTKAVGIFTAVAGAATVVGGAFRYFVNEAAEAEKVDAQLNAVLTSTKHAAGLTASEIQKLATSLQWQSTYGDEAIKSSSALLLTFTKVGKDVFPQAQQAILDVSTAMGQDLKTSTLQLGKALNDPIKGITALTRVGVSFTESQKEMIRTLTEGGDVMGAQKIILDELSREFGGSAAAAVNTYEGQVQQLKNAWSDSAEVIGSRLIPVMTDVLRLYTRVASAQERLETEGGFSAYEAHRLAMMGVGTAAEISGDQLDSATLSYTAYAQAMQVSGDAVSEAVILYDALLGSIGKLQSETDRYNSVQEEANNAVRQANADLEAGLITLEEKNAIVEKSKKQLEENAVAHEQWAARTVFAFAQAKAAADGNITEGEGKILIEMGVQLGLFDQKTADTMESVNRAFDSVDSENAQEVINALKEQMELLTGQPWNIVITATNNADLSSLSIGATPQAIGGAQKAGQPYLVHQDEIIVPARGGYTLTRTDAMNALSGGRGGNVTNNIYGGLTIVTEGGVQDALDDLTVLGG